MTRVTTTTTTLCWILSMLCVLPTNAQLPFTCDFEAENICSLEQATDDQQDWVVWSGSTVTANTGPTGGASGTTFYAYYETSNPVPQGDTARLVTPALGSTGPACVRFSYHMYGADIDRLEVFLQSGSSFSGATSLISWQGDQGNQWLEAELNVQLPSTNARISWEAERGSGIQGDISIDQIAISSGTCGDTALLPITCDFESGLCGWEQSTNEQLDWTRTDQGTPSSDTGPSTAGSGSWYLFIEATGQNNNDEATLLSPPIDYTGAACVTFLSHMYGVDIAELRVGTTLTTTTTISGDQGNSWIEREIDVSLVPSLQVLFTAVRGGDFRGDIAIDNVRVTAGACGSEPVTTTESPTTQPPTQPPSGTVNLPITCTFEGPSFCNLQQGQSDQFDWSTQSGSTGTQDTGPSGANGGTFYIYIETSDPRSPRQTAVLQTPPITQSGNICVRFYFHALGNGIGRFYVYTSRSGAGSPILDFTGSQGDVWTSADLDTTINSGDRVFFVGVVGSNIRGDIALDDLRITSGTCSQGSGNEINLGDPFVTSTCDMEGNGASSTTCRLAQSTADNFNWLQINGNTPSGAVHVRRINGVTYPLTGPRGASSGTNYIFTEASGRRQGDLSRLLFEGSDFQRGGNNCLRFSYNMNGYHQGSLTIYVMRSGNRVDLWSASGDGCREWCSAAVDANMNGVTQMGMDAVMTGFFSGDTAVDSVSMSAGLCDGFSPPTIWRCQFELNDGSTSLCRMEVDDNAQIDWVLWTGRTPSDDTGPTSASTGLYYVFMEASSPRVQGNIARIMTPALGATGTVCVTFDYHMYGFHMGTLRLSSRTSGGSETSRWDLSGDQGNAWRSASVTVDNLSTSHRLSFVGIRGSAFSSDIGLDNILVQTGSC